MLDYREEIIDHYKHPRNFGQLEGEHQIGKGINAACGDMVEYYIKVKSQKAKGKDTSIVEEVKWRGVGCAMSTAAASLLSEFVKEKTVEEIADMDQAVMDDLVGEVNPGRLKCVMLPLTALKAAIK